MMIRIKRRWLPGFALLAFTIGVGTGSRVLIRAATPGSSVGNYPVFEVDTTFPKLPNNWVLGNVAKVSVDRHDNVWIIHRPRTVPEGKTAAPPVVEWDAKGKFLQAWGGDGPGYDWPDAEHNVF